MENTAPGAKEKGSRMEEELPKMQTADYIEAALERASFETLGDGSLYAEIEGLEGVWANAATQEEAAQELGEVLEDWILLRISRGLTIPEIDGHTIEVPKSHA